MPVFALFLLSSKQKFKQKLKVSRVTKFAWSKICGGHLWIYRKTASLNHLPWYWSISVLAVSVAAVSFMFLFLLLGFQAAKSRPLPIWQPHQSNVNHYVFIYPSYDPKVNGSLIMTLVPQSDQKPNRVWNWNLPIRLLLLNPLSYSPLLTCACRKFSLYMKLRLQLWNTKYNNHYSSNNFLHFHMKWEPDLCLINYSRLKLKIVDTCH